MVGFILKVAKRNSSSSLDMEKGLRYFKQYKEEKIVTHFSTFCDLKQIRRESNWYIPYEGNNLKIWISGGMILSEKEANQYSSFSLALASWYLEDGIKSVLANLNGPYFVLIEDSKLETVYLITDKMGFTPVFEFEDDENWIFSSHPDAIATVKSPYLNLDKTSIAEYLRYGRIEFPNTYYREIKQLEVGKLVTFKKHKRGDSLYWAPEAKFLKNKLNAKKLTKQLSKAIQEAVYDLTNPSFGKHGLFLSGGTDSRAILFSANDRNSLKSSTFYDQTNAELQTAKELAKRANVKHEPLKRSLDHYAVSALEYSFISNGMGALHDNHYLSFRGKLKEQENISWHTGCFADWFFKGIAYNFKYLTVANKVFPTWKLLTLPQQSFYISESELSQEYKGLVDHRLEQQFNFNTSINLNSDTQLWQIELMRLRPINRECDFGSRQTLKAYFNWIPLLSDNRLIDEWQKISPRQKLNGEIWSRAVARICRGHNDIKDNNWGTVVGTSKYWKTLFFLIEVIKRKLRKPAVNAIATTGSWPNFKEYLNQSELLPKFWKHRVHPNSEIIEEILDYDPFRITPKEWSNKDVTLFNRIFTLNLWLELQINNFDLNSIQVPQEVHDFKKESN